jgi:hypothetical protein
MRGSMDSFPGARPHDPASVRGPSNSSLDRKRFHESFNFDRELKETLNERRRNGVSAGARDRKIQHHLGWLREKSPLSTPWHIGCKLFRRFGQISLLLESRLCYSGDKITSINIR